jgi:hypothetical protein
MLSAIPAVIIGWVAYWLWMRKIIEEEKKQPKKKGLSASYKDQERNLRLGTANGKFQKT